MARSSTLKVARTSVPARAKKTKTAVCLSDAAIKRLGAACVYHDADQSALVEWMINEYLSGYVLQVRGQPIRINGQSEDQASLGAPVMADDRLGADAHVNPPAHLAL